MKKFDSFLTVCIMLVFAHGKAQDTADTLKPRLLQGISLKQDSIFEVNIHFRIQSRFGYASENMQQLMPGILF